MPLGCDEAMLIPGSHFRSSQSFLLHRRERPRRCSVPRLVALARMPSSPPRSSSRAASHFVGVRSMLRQRSWGQASGFSRISGRRRKTCGCRYDTEAPQTDGRDCIPKASTFSALQTFTPSAFAESRSRMLHLPWPSIECIETRCESTCIISL
jgi:hypothetical protein